jgi:hypothetical protein
MKTETEVILPSDPRAAHYVTDIKGWVSRDGRFYGDDERLARWAGSTHNACEACEAVTERPYTKCPACRAKNAADRHAKREMKPWDGVGFIYSDALGKYFADADDLDDYLADDDALGLDELRLLHCEPIFAAEIDPGEHYHDSLPDDSEDVPAWLDEAFDALNETIRKHRQVSDALSWVPGKIAVDIASIRNP